MERNLIPCEVPHLEKSSSLLLPHALQVLFGAISLPHPEKIAEGGAKAVNRRHEGWGGEDAYFCSPGRYVFPASGPFNSFPLLLDCTMRSLQS